MKIDIQLLKRLMIMASHFDTIAKYFALTEQQLEDPNAADWIIDRIKQFQTAYMIRKATVEKIDYHPPVSTLPPLPTEAIEKTDTV